MNHLSIIEKHVKAIESSYLNIKTDGTREKARWAIHGLNGRLFAGNESVAIPEPVQASVPVEAVLTREEGKSDCGAVSVAASLPVVPEEPAIVGDLEGSGTFYPETVTSLPVEMIGGWPERGEMEIMGLAPNRRHLTASLPDGRKVSVERTFGRLWKPGEKVQCRIVRAGAAPLFRVV
jgi:hypothetical protein